MTEMNLTDEKMNIREKLDPQATSGQLLKVTMMILDVPDKGPSESELSRNCLMQQPQREGTTLYLSEQVLETIKLLIISISKPMTWGILVGLIVPIKRIILTNKYSHPNL